MKSAKFRKAARRGLSLFMPAAALLATVMLSSTPAQADTTPDMAHTNPVIVMGDD
jgi:hypothetical protein